MLQIRSRHFQRIGNTILWANIWPFITCGCCRIQSSIKRYMLSEVLVCSIGNYFLLVVAYFDDPARRVKIQTMSKYTQRYHTPKRLYFMGIFQKVGKATQIEKCNTRSQPIKQVFFLQYKITKCTISQEIFTRIARYLYSSRCNWIIMSNYLIRLSIIS